MSENYSFSKKFIEGEVLSTFWNLAIKFVVLINSVIILTLLTVYDFGLYQLVISFITIANSLALGGIDAIVEVGVSRLIGQANIKSAKKLFLEYAGVKIVLSAVFAVLVFFGAEIISNYYNSGLEIFIKIASIMILIEGLQSIQDSFFRSNISFLNLSVPLVGELVKTLILVILLIIGQGLNTKSVLILHVICQSCALIFSSFYFIKAYFKFFTEEAYKKNSLLWPLIKSFGFWVLFRNALSKLSSSARLWLVKFFLNTEAVAIYGLARSALAFIITLFPIGTLGLLLPREVDDPKRLRYIFARMLKYTSFLGVFLGVCFFVFVPIGINNFFPKYSEAVPLIKIMSVVFFLYGIYKVLRMIIIALQEQRILLIRSFDNTFLSVGLLALLLPSFGVNGAAWEYVITYAITTILFYYWLIKAHPYLKIKIREIFIFKQEDILFVFDIYKNSMIIFRSYFLKLKLKFHK